MNNVIQHFGWSTAFLLVLLCCGCFQAENPFYRESDIVTDRRLEGRFVIATTNSNSTLSDSYEIKPGNLKYKTSAKGQPIDPHIEIITNSTEELHALLLAEGGSEEVFGFKGTMFKRKE